MKPTLSIPLFHLIASALFFVAGPTLPANAQLDIPGYVPCYPGSSGDLATTSPDPLTLTIATGDVRQTVHNFGASDAWS